MNIIIQKELPEHYRAIHNILITCFKSDAESKLVAALRNNDKVILSLVAVQNSKVIGHVMFTPVTTSPSSITKGLGLAPLAVKPKYQKQGVGAQLVKEGLSMCAELEYDYVVLLGIQNITNALVSGRPAILAFKTSMGWMIRSCLSS